MESQFTKTSKKNGIKIYHIERSTIICICLTKTGKTMGIRYAIYTYIMNTYSLMSVFPITQILASTMRAAFTLQKLKK